MRATRTYLTTEQLAERIHYDVCSIRNMLLDTFLIEGRHYIRPFGRRKLLFIWETIEADWLSSTHDSIGMMCEQQEVVNG
ncbi:hypothetical protein GCM10010919_27600 [Alishewanella longhuensis]|uniref:DNA-binding protein n=1 Tax=Alishewanella longhuensis TaxID=1091037 RepID=A0ABQ3L0U5_9ALTE|nr:hypothetical protein [Alishewanella longhuensis]GHG74255.1 hypothetical protein GCM10010919_27600 [Alishewanella longhuensis]